MNSSGSVAAAAGCIAELTASLPAQPGSQDVIAALQKTLLNQKDYHRLFDARLIQVRHELGLPLSQPTSLDNVPAVHEKAFRDAYVNAARDVGLLFLNDSRLSDAWAYFRTIGEPQPIRDAINKMSIPREPNAQFDEALNVALYEGAHISRGLEFLLKTHGTCNTVTAFSQLQGQMTPEERRRSAAMMVRTIYDDVQAGVRRQVEARMPLIPPTASLRELITGRDWVFEEGNYHIDVSHLHSTVGFARSLQAEDHELKQAIELCDYGSRLAPSLQYPGEIPFDDYYVANRHFLKALAGDSPDESLDYFLQRLRSDPDVADKRLVAFVLLDLAQRIGKLADVIDETASLVSRMEDANGFSFTRMCLDMGLVDRLETEARQNDDVLAFAIAMLSRQGL